MFVLCSGPEGTATSCELLNHMCRCASLPSTPLQLLITSHAVICRVVERYLLVHTLLHHLQSSTFLLNANFKMQNVGCFNFTGLSTLSLQSVYVLAFVTSKVLVKSI